MVPHGSGVNGPWVACGSLTGFDQTEFTLLYRVFFNYHICFWNNFCKNDRNFIKLCVIVEDTLGFSLHPKEKISKNVLLFVKIRLKMDIFENFW
ncbi:MAG: hypothetical protein GY820_31355 [Gammaproteobacteria bacterium]|nr:hypothetical protein [Gammaproteobacteria bacterium]